MPNIPIPEEDYKQHVSLRFKQRTDELAVPFEEQERDEAYRSQESQSFRARTDELIDSFDAEQKQAESAEFRARTDALIAPFQAQEQAPAQATPKSGLDVRAVAQKYGLDPDIFEALGATESSGQQVTADGKIVTSSAGARGRYQLMPDTARALGVDPDDEGQNVEGAARYLRENLDRYGGDYTKALAAYNAGPGNVDKYGGIPPFEETQAHVSRTMAKAEELRRSGPGTYEPEALAIGVDSVVPGGSIRHGFRDPDYLKQLGEEHDGIDIASEAGAPVRSPVGGRVIFAGQDNSGINGGIGVVIRTDDGRDVSVWHLGDAGAQVGQRIEPGSVLGAAGATGNARYVHTHLQAKDTKTGGYLDPTPLLAGSGANNGPAVAADAGFFEEMTNTAPDDGVEATVSEIDKLIPRDFMGTVRRAMEEANTPDIPSPMMGPFAPPQLGKAVQMDREAQEKIEKGEALTVGDFVRNLTNWARRQGETLLPVGPGTIGTAEETVGKGFARGLTDSSGSGAIGAGGKMLAAGDVSGAGGAMGGRLRPGQMSREQIRRTIDETGTSPLWTDYYYHSADEYGGAGLQPSGRGGQVWLNADAPVQRPGSVGLAIDKSKLDPALLDVASNGYPVYKGPIPPDAITVLGKIEHGGKYDGRTLHEAFQAAESTAPRVAVGGDILTSASGRPLRPVKGDTTEILDQTGKVLREVTVKLPPRVREEFLQPEALMPAKDVPLIRQVFDRTRNVIESMGEAGKELGQRVHQWREGAELDAAEWVNRMPTVKAIKSSEEFAKVVDVLEGRAKPASPRIAQAAAEAKAVLDDVYARAQNAGVGVAEKIENYFPHVYKPEKIRELTDVKRRAEMIRRVMAERAGTTEDEAEQIIERYVRASRDRRHGSLEMSRLADLPGYEKTREALYNHLVTASRRIHEVAQFGKDDAIASKLMDRLGAEGYDRTLARELFQTIVGAGNHSEAARRVSGAARVYHSVTRLGLSALLNATQSVNTATVTGTVRTLQSMAKAGWSQSEKEFADKTGVTLDTIIKEMKEGAGFSDKLGKFSAPGFGAVELFNRRVAAIAGRDFAREMAENAAKGGRGGDSAKRALTKLRLDADAIVRRGGKLNEQEEVRAARAIVERSQFRVDPQDLPQWASHPLGKVVAQFRTFGYGQNAFVVREVLDEAKQGNALPLVRFAILGLVAQGAATEARNVITGREPEEDTTMRVLQYGLGLTGEAGSMARTLFGVNSKRVPPNQRVARAITSQFGPTVSTIGDVITGGLSAAEGDPEPAMRTALRQVPVLGQLTVNRAFPYKKAEDDARGGSRSGTRTIERNSRGGR